MKAATAQRGATNGSKVADDRSAASEDLDFQQAKNPAEGPQFLQIGAKPDRGTKAKPEPKLTRVAFRVSRLMEFSTQRHLQNQTAHSVYDSALVVRKQVMNN